MATKSTDSYSIGAVDLYFEASIAHSSLLATAPAVASGLGGAFRTSGHNLGNIVTAEINPEVTYVEHWVSDCGMRKRDKKAANVVSMSIPFTFDEINEGNLQKFFLASNLSTTKLAVFEEPIQEGSAQLVFRTDVGQDMTYFIPKCTIGPDGALAANAEDWWTGPMVLDIMYYDTGSWASKPYGMILASTIDCA